MKVDIDLNTLGKGDLKRKTDKAVGDVIHNIQDPSTSRKKARKVIITLTMSPDDDEDEALTDIDVKTVLAPQRGSSTQLWFGDGAVTEREIGDAPPVPEEEEGEAA